MIVHRFFAFMRTAPAEARAAATGSLAQAYLCDQLDPAERPDAVTAMMLALDDEEPLVRYALAVALAQHPDAPRTVIVALAADQSDIAAIVLAGSPVINEAELIHHAVMGNLAVQVAIADRLDLAAPVAAALAEIGDLGALVALARNASACIPEFAMKRMLDRCGENTMLRQALAARQDLSLPIRQAIIAACAKGAEKINTPQGQQTGMAEDAAERATVALAAGASPQELTQLARHLRCSGQLTSRLVLRAFIVGQVAFSSAMLVELSGLSASRVEALLQDGRGAGFAALYRKARLPQSLLGVFVQTIESRREILRAQPETAGARLARLIVGRVLERCQTLVQPGFESLLVMLRQLETEAAREDARNSERDLTIEGWSRELFAQAMIDEQRAARANDVLDLDALGEAPSRQAAA
jgi:uncharacterized protein (DUF2336 family)